MRKRASAPPPSGFRMTASFDTDILIVGAGPAGSTLAALAPPRLSVTLLDRRDLAGPPGKGEKPCGGLLAPAAQKQLFHLGLGLPPDVLCGPQLFGVVAHDLDTGQIRAFRRNYLNIHRPLFDRLLFARAAAAPNVTSVTGKRAVRFVEEPDAVVAHLDDGGHIRARLLVGADGAQSVVRRHLEPAAYDRPEGKTFPAAFGGAHRLLAMQRIYRVKKAPAAFEVFFHPEMTDFYAWSIPKDDTLVVGLAAPWGMPDPLGRMNFLGERLHRLGRHTGEVLAAESCALLRPGIREGVSSGRGRTALIGEAGGFISPSSAEGVSFALASAQALARALGKHPNLNDRAGRDLAVVAAHRKNTLPTAMRLRTKWAKFAVMYTPWIRFLALAACSTRMPLENPNLI